jgi:cold shock CspA family protein
MTTQSQTSIQSSSNVLILPKTQCAKVSELLHYPHLAIKNTCKTAPAVRELVRKGVAKISTDSGYPDIPGHTRYVLIREIVMDEDNYPMGAMMANAPVIEETDAFDITLADDFPNVAIDVLEEVRANAQETPVESAQEYHAGEASLPSIDDIVEFTYFYNSEFAHEVYTGTVKGVKAQSCFGPLVLIAPDANRFHLTPRWIQSHKIRKVLVSARATVTYEDVRRLERVWWTAQDAPRNLDEAMSEPFASNTRNAHTAFLIAQSRYLNAPWMMPCQEDIDLLAASQSASQTRQEGVSSPLPSDEVTVSIEAQSAAPVAVESKSVESVHPLGDVPHFSLESTDNRKRYEGVVSHWNAQGGWGYVSVAGQKDASIREDAFLGVAPFNITKGARLTFTLTQGKTRDVAAKVCVIGHAESESEYRDHLDASKRRIAESAAMDKAAQDLAAQRKIEYNTKRKEIQARNTANGMTMASDVHMSETLYPRAN